MHARTAHTSYTHMHIHARTYCSHVVHPHAPSHNQAYCHRQRECDWHNACATQCQHSCCNASAVHVQFIMPHLCMAYASAMPLQRAMPWKLLLQCLSYALQCIVYAYALPTLCLHYASSMVLLFHSCVHAAVDRSQVRSAACGSATFGQIQVGPSQLALLCVGGSTEHTCIIAHMHTVGNPNLGFSATCRLQRCV